MSNVNSMYGSGPGANAGQAIFTDDVSLQVFMEHLKRLVSWFFLVAWGGMLMVIHRRLVRRPIE